MTSSKYLENDHLVRTKAMTDFQVHLEVPFPKSSVNVEFY